MRSSWLTGLFLFMAAVASALPARAEIARGDTPGAVEWQSGNTLFLAGRDLTIDRAVNGSLTATGETVSITRDARIARDAWIAARRVAFEGDVQGELSIRSQDAIINGHVKGNVSFYGVHLAFGPDADIEGNVNYFAATPAEIDSGAKIAGNMRSKVWDGAAEEGYRPEFRERRQGWWAPGYRLSWPGAIVFGFIAGLVAVMAPAASLRLHDSGMSQPALAFLIGLVWLVGTPILAVISAVTIIGLPLAFIVLMLWPLGVLVGLVVAIVAIGESFAGRMRVQYQRNGRIAGGIAVATILLWIGISLPAFGGVVWLAAVTFGVGALVLSARVA